MKLGQDWTGSLFIACIDGNPTSNEFFKLSTDFEN